MALLPHVVRPTRPIAGVPLPVARAAPRDAAIALIFRPYEIFRAWLPRPVPRALLVVLAGPSFQSISEIAGISDLA